MPSRSNVYASVLAVALLLSPTVAPAALVVYSSRTAFTAAVSGPGIDTYLDFSISGQTPSPINRTAGPHAYTGSASTSNFFGAGSTSDPWLSTNIAEDTITFNGFPANVFAIGGNFFNSSITGSFAAGNIIVTATDGDGPLAQTIVAATTASFIGFVSDSPPITLTVSAVQPSSGFIWPTVDNLTLAQILVTDRIFENGFD